MIGELAVATAMVLLTVIIHAIGLYSVARLLRVEEREEAAAHIHPLSPRGFATTQGDRPLRLLGKMNRLDGAELGAFFDRAFLKLKYNILGRLDRYAIVGGPAWLRAWVAALDKLTKAESRHIKASDEPVAWQWLDAQPTRHHPLVS